MTDSLLFVAVGLLVAALALLLVLLKKVSRADGAGLAARLEAFEKAQERTEQTVRAEVALNRGELGQAAREQRLELTEAFKSFGDATVERLRDVAGLQKAQLDTMSEAIAKLTESNERKLETIRATVEERLLGLQNDNARQWEQMAQRMRDLGGIQKAQLDAMSEAIAKLTESNEKKLEAVRLTVEEKLQSLQSDNARQLEQMRQTVDEKLQGTLEKRLGESFKLVSDRLEQVHKGLGEMQTLATGVGDLKKVLTNVKTRGTWGEVQLGALLEQVLSPDQFALNVATKDGGERVEFAVRLPGQGSDKEETVWLPIDAKFPVEDYQRLLEAQERGDAEGVEAAGKQLENRVKACAAEICGKYLNPPKTTDFAILFLPIEGLFAEVIRRTGLAEAVQRDRRVVIAGPTTLWSILSSLQMGFRTLAIQKRSSEVWNLLAAVKTEWTKYGDVLDAVQKKLTQASDTIEKAKVRSRAVGRKLKDVQELPVGEAAALLTAELPEEDVPDVSEAADDEA